MPMIVQRLVRTITSTLYSIASAENILTGLCVERSGQHNTANNTPRHRRHAYHNKPEVLKHLDMRAFFSSRQRTACTTHKHRTEE